MADDHMAEIRRAVGLIRKATVAQSDEWYACDTILRHAEAMRELLEAVYSRNAELEDETEGLAERLNTQATELISDLLTWFDASRGYSDISAEQRIRTWANEQGIEGIDPEARW